MYGTAVRRVFERLGSSSSSSQKKKILGAAATVAATATAAGSLGSFVWSKTMPNLKAHAYDTGAETTTTTTTPYQSAANPLGLFPGDDPQPAKLSNTETQELQASLALPDSDLAPAPELEGPLIPLTNPGAFERIEDVAKGILGAQRLSGVKVTVGLVPDTSAFKSSHVQASFHIEPRDLEAEKKQAMMARMMGQPLPPDNGPKGNYHYKWSANSQIVLQQLGHLLLAQREDDGRMIARYMYLQPQYVGSTMLIMDPQSGDSDVFLVEGTYSGNDSSLTGKFVSTETHSAISSTYMQAITPVLSAGASIDHVPAAGRTMLTFKGVYKSLPEVDPNTQEVGASRTLVSATLGMNGTATITGFHQILPQAAIAAELESNILAGEHQLTIGGNLKNDLHDTTVTINSDLDATMVTEVPINPLVSVVGSAAYIGSSNQTKLGLEVKLGAAR